MRTNTTHKKRSKEAEPDLFMPLLLGVVVKALGVETYRWELDLMPSLPYSYF